MMINTHALFKELIALGFTEGQAEKLSEMSIEKNIDNLATKEQMESIKDWVGAVEKEQLDIKTDIIDIKTDIKILKNDVTNIKEIMATKSDISALRGEITEVKYDILKWILPLFLVIIIKLFYPA